MHLKGMGSFRPLNEKPSFVANFDKYTSGQRYLGMSKLMLNNASQDNTYLAEMMGCQIVPRRGSALAARHPRLRRVQRPPAGP